MANAVHQADSGYEHSHTFTGTITHAKYPIAAGHLISQWDTRPTEGSHVHNVQGLPDQWIEDWQPDEVQQCLAASPTNFVGLMTDGRSVLKYPHHKCQITMDALHEEAERYQRLGCHENLVTFVSSHRDGLVLEYCERGQLREVIEDLSDHQKRTIAVQVVRCLVYLHGQHYIHGDLNVSNVFVTSGMIAKVGDLQGQLYRPDGSIELPAISQESAKSRHPYAGEDEFSERTDIFALGTLLYHLRYGHAPFPDLSEHTREELDEIQARYRVGQYPIDIAEAIGMDKIICHCWHSVYQSATEVLESIMALGNGDHNFGMTDTDDSATGANGTNNTESQLHARTHDLSLAGFARSPLPLSSCVLELDQIVSPSDISTSPGASQRDQEEAEEEEEVDKGERPQLRSTADVKMFEAFHFETGAFIRCFYTYFDDEHRAWIGQNTKLRKYDLLLGDIVLSLRKIPDEMAFPEAPEQITMVPLFDPAKHFVKRPQVHCLSDEFESTLIPQMHIEEARILEYLKQHPHPNIVPYHGCVIKHGRIVGIVLKRLHKTLEQRLRDSDASNLNVEILEKQLRSAIAHIHALGLAHNDLNPSNLALDESDQLAIIDWGSCKELGKELISAGTPGWIDKEYDISKQEHDLTAIDKVISWVRKNNRACRKKDIRTA
ncbi:hypothetical protein AC579_6237 [Pseudocercospora musae]|uniref:Protein kinase domain-containing protein n=1 Tax=Pseudocercospora musae TaxID=113226 RepID=A0A139HN15_9PEZI|nr:hypothetical protein AC579_6237 [Pseudocercospora musae]